MVMKTVKMTVEVAEKLANEQLLLRISQVFKLRILVKLQSADTLWPVVFLEHNRVVFYILGDSWTRNTFTPQIHTWDTTFTLRRGLPSVTVDRNGGAFLVAWKTH